MKKAKLLIILLLAMPMMVYAAPSDSISTDKNSIENGQSVTVTVTLKDTAAWNIKINGTGAATCSKKEADVTADGKSTTKSFSLTCTSTQEGTIVFTVTGDITSGSAETKDVSLRKEVTVTKPKSSVNTLSSLKVDGTAVAGFTSANTSYTINDVNKTSVNITATATDSKATITGTGTKNLQYGANSFNIVVTAENGAQRTYTIVINRRDTRSGNNNLKSLSVDKGKINFSKNTTSYTVNVDHDVKEITISASAEDSKATVSGAGKKTLKDYSNDFNVVVTAENGAQKTYTIKVIRKDAEGNVGALSADNTVSSITITNYDFKFSPEIKSYNILVEENVNAIEIKTVPNHAKATVEVKNNTNLKPGLNKVVVTITSEKGTKNEYVFNVYKIGDVKEGEEEPEPKEEEKENKKKGINFWFIVALLEFIGIVVLLLSKKKKNNKGTNNTKETIKPKEISKPKETTTVSEPYYDKPIIENYSEANFNRDLLTGKPTNPSEDTTNPDNQPPTDDNTII